MKSYFRLETTVVHGGDNVLRARAASVSAVNDAVRSKTEAALLFPIEKAIVFSWAKTMGDDRPSEAMKMYETFVKRLRILDLENRIPGGIGIPDIETEENGWAIRIGKQIVSIYIEEDSVDTEDNAEKSGTIIRKILDKRFYDHVAVFPLSSDFHTKRITEAFRRNLESAVPTSVQAVSAENVLEGAGGRYARYAALKRNSVLPKTKILEILLRVASKFETWRNAVRKVTRKRVSAPASQ